MNTYEDGKRTISQDGDCVIVNGVKMPPHPKGKRCKNLLRVRDTYIELDGYRLLAAFTENPKWVKVGGKSLVSRIAAFFNQ